MLVDVDLSETPEDVKPGEYRVVVQDAKPGEWSTGTKYLNWRLATVGETDPKNNGRAIWHKTPTHGKGAAFLARFYSAAMGEELGGSFETEAIYGKELVVVVDYAKDKEGQVTGRVEVVTVKAL